MTQKIHRSVLLNWIGLFSKMAVSVLLLPVIVAGVGVEGYGEYAFLIAIFGYSGLLEFGLRAAILRYTGNLSGRGDYEQLNRILGTIFKYYAFVAAVVCLCGAVLFVWTPSWLVPDGASNRFPMYLGVAASVAASSFFRLGWSSVVRARERYDLLNLIDVSAVLLRAGVIVLGLEKGWGLAAVLVGDLFENLYATVASRLAIARDAPEIHLEFSGLDRDRLADVLGYSGWAFATSMAMQLRVRGPSAIIGAVIGAGDLGLFGVAARLQSYALQLGTSMNSPFRARATTLAGGDDDESVREILYLGTRYLTLLAGTICGLLFVYADELLVTWMDDRVFHTSAAVLRILLVGIAFEISAMMLGGALYATGRLRTYALTNLGEALAIVVATTVLAKQGGLMLAVWGIAVPIVVNKGLVQPLLLLRILDVSIAKMLARSLARPVLTLTLAAGPIWVLRTAWPPTSLVMVAIHFVLSAGLIAAIAFVLVLERSDRERVLRRLGLSGRA